MTRPRASVHRLWPPEIRDRGAKDKLLYSIPEDATYLIAWRDPVTKEVFTQTSDGIARDEVDKLAFGALRRALTTTISE